MLSVRNVVAGYRGVPVLQDVSIGVGRGTTTAVVGESGSGKSTLARVITGLLPPQSGDATFNGVPLPPTLKDRSLDQRRCIQLISQSADTSLSPRQRIAEILGRPRRLYFEEQGSKLEQRVKELLSMVELPSACAERYPSELSGGQKQRVAIARALAAEPELLICDEITSGLDQIVAESILKLLLDHQRERHIAYLFITHDLATVNSIADQVAVMWRGRVVEQGLKSEVMAPPHHDYTRKLLASVPQMDPNWLDRVFAGQSPRTGQ